MNSKVNFFFGVFTSFLMLLCWNIFEIEQTGLANLQIDKKNVNDILYKEVRVLCWIMTSPTNLKKKAMHVKNTWLPRCNKYLFMSSPDNGNYKNLYM